MNQFDSTLDDCYLDFIADFQGELNEDSDPSTFTVDLTKYKFPNPCK